MRLICLCIVQWKVIVIAVLYVTSTGWNPVWIRARCYQFVFFGLLYAVLQLNSMVNNELLRRYSSHYYVNTLSISWKRFWLIIIDFIHFPLENMCTPYEKFNNPSKQLLNVWLKHGLPWNNYSSTSNYQNLLKQTGTFCTSNAYYQKLAQHFIWKLWPMLVFA